MKNTFAFLILTFLWFQSSFAQNEWIVEHPLTIDLAPIGVAFDANDDLMFICQGAGLFRVDNGQSVSLSNAPENSDLTSFQIDGQDIWVGGYGGGGVFNNNSWENFTSNNGSLQGNTIYDVDITNGSVWLAMENEGASYYNGSSWDHYNASNGLIGQRHTCIAQNSIGEVFLGSNDWNSSTVHVNKFDGSNWTVIDVPGLGEISSIFIDSQDNLWAGGDGLAKYDGTSWIDYSSAMFSNSVTCINEASDGTIYFGMFNAGVGYMEGSTAVLIDVPDNFGYQGRTKGIAFDSQGEAYFCMGPTNLAATHEYGIYRYEPAADYSLQLSESQISGCSGETFTVDVTIGVDFDSSAVLTVTAPYPVNNLNPVPGETITMTVTIPGSTPGSLTETISVTDGTNTTDRNFITNIIGSPEMTNLQSPSNNATNVGLPISFDWSSTNYTNTYTLVVATDINLSNVIIDTEISDITFTAAMSTLNEQTTYYWQVVSTGDCGTSTSTVSSFTTEQSSSASFINNQEVGIHPNPANEIVHLSFDAPLTAGLQLRLLTVDGKEVYQQELSEGTEQETLNVAYLATGLYFLQLTSNDETFIQKVVIE